jgi:methylmalonyl-CoA mutase C-terminal domain/subunit
MAGGRIVVGAVGVDDTVQTVAQALRDAGREVVYVGGNQSPEQLVRTALAEDAAEIVVAADPGEVARVKAVRRELGADDIVVTAAEAFVLDRCDEPDPRQAEKNG